MHSGPQTATQRWARGLRPSCGMRALRPLASCQSPALLQSSTPWCLSISPSPSVFCPLITACIVALPSSSHSQPACPQQPHSHLCPLHSAPCCTDDQLRQLAEQRPATQRQLAALIGPEKAELYGSTLLTALLPAGQAAQGGAGGRAANDSAAAAAQQQPQQQQQHPAQAKPRQVQGRPAKQARKAEVVVLDSSDDDEAFAAAPARGAKRGKR